MKKANIAKIKNELSQFLNYVRKGGTVRVMDRDRPVADIVPIRRTEGKSDEAELLDSLEARGIVRRGSGKVPAEFISSVPKISKRDGQGAPSGVLQALLDERKEGR